MRGNSSRTSPGRNTPGSSILRARGAARGGGARATAPPPGPGALAGGDLARTRAGIQGETSGHGPPWLPAPCLRSKHRFGNGPPASSARAAGKRKVIAWGMKSHPRDHRSRPRPACLNVPRSWPHDEPVPHRQRRAIFKLLGSLGWKRASSAIHLSYSWCHRSTVPRISARYM